MPLSSNQLATSNRASIRYVEETSFGVTPATAPTALRFTGESLDLAITKTVSKEIRNDRLTSDMIPTDIASNGGIMFEQIYGEYDPFIAGVLGGSFVRYGTLGKGAAVSLTLAPTTLTAGTAPTGNDAFTNLVKGQWFRLTAPGSASDGQVLQVSPTIAPTSTVITISAATPVLGSGVVAACVIAANRVTDGTVNRSFSIERSFDDIGQFFIFRGMMPSKLSMDFVSSAIMTGSVDFMGKNGAVQNTTYFTGTPVASQTFSPLNSVTGIGNVLIDGVALSNTFIKSVKFSVDGKIRGLQAIGAYGPAAMAQGTLMISGTMEIYLADGTQYNKFVNNTDTSVTFGGRDGTNRGYQITFPRVKYGDAKVQAGGLDQDAMLSIPFTALVDSATGHSILFDAFTV